jgi:hypothetical protein
MEVSRQYMGANVRLENNLGLASLKAAMHVMLLMITRRVSTDLPFNTVKWRTRRFGDNSGIHPIRSEGTS